VTPVLLDALIGEVDGAQLLGAAAGVEVSDVAHDSRSVGPGTLFCCVPGHRTDGHDHAPAAVEAGAVALLVERPLDLPVPQLLVADARASMAPLAAAFFGHPSRSMAVVGVTGTNGKTTTTHLLRNVVEAAGRRAEVLGTLSGTRTTPEAPDLQRTLARWRDDGVEVVAMEVSSHALELHRVDATRFAVAVFTNLSRDHLDFHGSMESYFAAKARLFEPDLSDRGVANLDSPYGRLLADTASIPTDTFSLAEADDLRLEASGSSFTWRGQAVRLALGGAFNVANALAAAHAAVALGIDEATIAEGLSRGLVVPGRFELVDAGQPFPVIVDYAHTPDGLDQLLGAADDLVAEGPAGERGRVVVVFGCGGDRDATKRPAMGEVAASGADLVVVTADNSRNEDTAAIIGAVKQGFERVHPRRAAELVVEPDRRAAIALALAAAREGDVVLVAGKGHETTQDEGGVVTPFDDRVVVAEEWSRTGGSA
jgi:UDP-N-acetylmuramoyl-L-alanyl-D-glutamate--2,6-diaminopimelate ligase